jgi:hypothetical protein
MSTWALIFLTKKDLYTKDNALVNFFTNPVPYIGIVLLGLALVMLIEAIRVVLFVESPSDPPPKPVLVAAN